HFHHDCVVESSFVLTEKISSQDAIDLIAVLLEAYICRYHCNRIVFHTVDDQLVHAYQANAVRCDNHQFIYDVEEYRLQLENSVFDERGYIINQGRMESIPFGWFNTRDKGCGWIAAYNLLKLNGKTMLMKDVLAGLKRFAFIGNLLGQEKISLYFWLKKQGLSAHISVGTNAKIIKKMCASKSGILLYIHRTNAHYVAYEVLKDGRIQFYNAVYGKKNHITTASEFLSENSFIPLSSLIYVD
ncbi:MAG: hypothetical protein HXL40_07650, partial [Solobacterium sp.]|nr:hypothetical protein [Solobacterium sp.]